MGIQISTFAPNTIFEASRYGVSPNNANNATALQAAIDAANASGGGVVQLGAGIFNSGQIILKSNVVLRGNSISSTRIRAIAGLNDHLIRWPVVQTDTMRRIGLENLTIDGNKSNNTSGSGVFWIQENTGVSYGRDSQCWIKKCYIEECAQNGVQWGGAGNVSGQNYNIRSSSISECIFRSNGERGIRLGLVTDCFFHDVIVYNSGLAGIRESGVANCYYNQVKCYYNNQTIAGVDTGEFELLQSARSTYNQCEAQEGFKSGFYLDQLVDCTLTGCRADANAPTSLVGLPARQGYGFYVRNGTNLTLIGLQCNNFGGRSTQQYGVGLDTPGSNIQIFATSRLQGIQDYQLLNSDNGALVVVNNVIQHDLGVTTRLALNAASGYGMTISSSATTASTESITQISPVVTNGSGQAAIRFFRFTSTTGQAGLELHAADNTTTVNARIAAKGGTSYLGVGSGQIGLGYVPNAVGAKVQAQALTISAAASATNPGNGNLRVEGNSTFVGTSSFTGVATFTAAPSVPGGYRRAINFARITANATLAAGTDLNYVRFGDATTAPITVTLPAASASAGMVVRVKKVDASANTITIARAGADTIDGATTRVLTTQFQSVALVADSANGFWGVV